MSAFEYVETAKKEMLYRLKLWSALHQWGVVLIEKWKTAPFEEVDVNEITTKAEHYTNTPFQRLKDKLTEGGKYQRDKIALQCERNLPPGSTAVARLK